MQPHAPTSGELRALPQREGRQGHGDDLGDSTLGLELREETHLRDVEGGYLLTYIVAILALLLGEGLNFRGVLHDTLSIELQVENPVQLLSLLGV